MTGSEHRSYNNTLHFSVRPVVVVSIDVWRYRIGCFVMLKALSVYTVNGMALTFCNLLLSICIVLFTLLTLYCIGVNPGPFTWGSQCSENRQTRQGTARGHGSVSNNSNSPTEQNEPEIASQSILQPGLSSNSKSSINIQQN